MEGKKVAMTFTPAGGGDPVSFVGTIGEVELNHEVTKDTKPGQG